MKISIKQYIDKARKLEEELNVDIPIGVKRFFGAQMQISSAGSTISISEYGDFGSLEELRQAIDWFAEQLDGTVVWWNNSPTHMEIGTDDTISSIYDEDIL